MARAKSENTLHRRKGKEPRWARVFKDGGDAEPVSDSDESGSSFSSLVRGVNFRLIPGREPREPVNVVFGTEGSPGSPRGAPPSKGPRFTIRFKNYPRDTPTSHPTLNPIKNSRPQEIKLPTVVEFKG